MTGAAVFMLIFAICLVWGGLVASILFLRARPEVTTGPGAVDPDGEPTEDDFLYRDL